MGAQSLIGSQINKSQARLSFPSDLARILIEDAFIRADKHVLEPMSGVESSFTSLCESVCQVAATETSKSESFLATTTGRIKEKIHSIVGRSPDIISDIIKAVGDIVGGVIAAALKPVTDTIGSLSNLVKNGFTAISTTIGGLFTTALRATTDFIAGGLNAITSGVNFIGSTVNALLEGVSAAFMFITMAIKSGVDFLGDTLGSLLSFEIEDVLKFQTDMQDKMREQQTERIKNVVAT